MATVRVVHYVNQFFAGLGGEEAAGTAPGWNAGPRGPGQLLQQALGIEGEVVGTLYCGDDRLVERPEAALAELMEAARRLRPAVVVAGPAFSSGRYGLACVALGKALRESLGISTVVGLHPDNPAVGESGPGVYIVPTGATAASMGEAMPRLARLALKLATGTPLGPAAEEGYLPTGRRQNVLVERPGAERAVDLLVQRLRGEAFATEWPVIVPDTVQPAPPLADVSQATIGIATEGGCVPRGNPDRIPSAWATNWTTYPVPASGALSPEAFDSIHGGYDTTYVRADLHRLVPVDVARELADEGTIGRLWEQFASTCGNMASIGTAQEFGRELAAELRSQGVDGLILTAT